VGHGNDDMALFASCVDIPVSFGSLFQWVVSIYDRFYLSRFSELFEEIEVLRVFAGFPCRPGYNLLAASLRKPAPAK
jgi:hypothetical protein